MQGTWQEAALDQQLKAAELQATCLRNTLHAQHSRLQSARRKLALLEG
jgi:hypothetical protein